MAVGACVCDAGTRDAVSADDITPPWLVWEWFVVEAFVRAEELALWKFWHPGIQKVRRAVRNQRPVSATAYLKTPTTFGFTGVFRRLAREVSILTDDGRSTTGATNWSPRGPRTRVWTASLMHPAVTGTPTASGFGVRYRRAWRKGHTTPQPGSFGVISRSGSILEGLDATKKRSCWIAFCRALAGGYDCALE